MSSYRNICRVLYLTVSAGSLVFAGCAADKDATSEDTATGLSADVEVSLASDVMPLVAASCGGCHTRLEAPFPAAVANGAFYDDVDDMMALVGTFIVPGDAAASGFVAILNQDFAVGEGPTLMPPPGMGEPMAADDVDVVMAWIDDGAENN